MLELISQSIQKELETFNKFYRKALRTPTNDFPTLLDFILKEKGKQIRPIMLILSARLCGTPTCETIKYAVILELLHTSTLLHDDVIDNAILRRGKPSVMAKFGNKTAVLLGDYILSKAIELSVKTKNFNFLQIMANLARNLSEGELTQLILSSKILLKEDCYFEIIRKKTAVFFSACLETGALSVHSNPEKRKILHIIGENLGICFQIRDDLLDYLKSEEVGKSTHHDIIEGQITLPLIYALKVAPKAQSNSMIKLIKKQDFSSENVNRILSFVKEQQGISYSKRKMTDIKQKIIELLDYFAASEAKDSLIALVNYITERKN